MAVVEQLGAGGGGAAGGIGCGGFVGEAHFHLFAEVGFVQIGYLESCEAVSVVEIEVPLVQQQLNVAL